MRILLIQKEQLSHFDTIEGQHRLKPCLLSDGSAFLSADCLTEPHFIAQLEGVAYIETTLDEIKNLLIQSEPLEL